MISLERILNRYVTRKPERELWYEIMAWNIPYDNVYRTATFAETFPESFNSNN